jgi:hypothetical protein
MCLNFFIISEPVAELLINYLYLDSISNVFGVLVMKILVKLRIVLLIIGAIAVNAHMIIPHDHHLSDSFAGQYNECPVSDNGGGHHTGMPVHCHACNDLASEKSVILVAVSHFASSDFLTGNYISYKNPNLHFAGFVNKEFSVNHSDSDYDKINLLRAPPAIIQ